MPRSRIFYSNEAVFVSDDNATGYMFSSGNSGVNLLNQLHRVQSSSYSFSVNRENVSQFGQLAPIDQSITTPPVVNADISWLVTNVNNAHNIGLTVNNGINITSGLLGGEETDKNYFISIAPQGQDAANYAPINRSVVGLGNMFITNFTAEGAVGGFPTESITLEGYNFKAYNVASGVSPAIDPDTSTLVVGKNFLIPVAQTGYNNQITAIRPGDIKMDLSNINVIGAVAADLVVQNYSISIDLSRSNIDGLGKFYPKSKEINVPIPVTLSVSTIVRDTNTGDLNQILCNDKGYQIDINLLAPSCPPTSGAVAVRYTIKGAKLASHNYSLDTTALAKTLDLEFTAFVGGATDVNNGAFISGRLDT